MGALTEDGGKLAVAVFATLSAALHVLLPTTDLNQCLCAETELFPAEARRGK